jgi:hypothetical protein
VKFFPVRNPLIISAKKSKRVPSVYGTARSNIVMKILGSKIHLLTILGLIVLLFVTMTAYGGGPTPGGRVHNAGPAVMGTVTITPSAEVAPNGQHYLL